MTKRSSGFSGQVMSMVRGGLVVVILLILAVVVNQGYGKDKSKADGQNDAPISLTETYVNEKYKFGFKYPDSDLASLQEFENEERYLLEITVPGDEGGEVSVLFEVISPSKEEAVLKEIRDSVDIPVALQEQTYESLREDGQWQGGGGIPGLYMNLYVADPWAHGWSQDHRYEYLVVERDRPVSVIGFITEGFPTPAVYIHLQDSAVLLVSGGTAGGVLAADLLERIVESVNPYLK